MTLEEKKEAIRKVLRKYIADDGLRPEFDGLTAYGLAEIILKEIEL